MVNPLIRKLEQRDTLSDEEKRVLDGAIARVKDYAADEDIVRAHDQPTESTLLLEGWACRYVILGNGRRQVLAFHIPGDFVDLYSFPLKKMDHNVGTLTPCKAAVVPHQTLREITEGFPHLTRMLWLNTLIDGSIFRAWLASAGQRSAPGRMAHLLCELYLRLRVVGRTEGTTFRMPVTQAEFGDAIGLSTVHTNRTVQQLRAAGLIQWRGEAIVIEDWERLQEVADFDPTYLHLDREPR